MTASTFHVTNLTPPGSECQPYALEELSRRHPDNAHTWHALGTLLQELGEFEEAVAAFERGAAAGPRQGAVQVESS
jgi:uncharacterized protein HemY